MVFEGGPHAFGLLRRSVGLLVPVQVIRVILVAAWEVREQDTGTDQRPEDYAGIFTSVRIMFLQLFAGLRQKSLIIMIIIMFHGPGLQEKKNRPSHTIWTQVNTYISIDLSQLQYIIMCRHSK